MFSRRLEEVESLMDRVENDAKDQVEVASSKFHEKASEASSLRLENERLKVNSLTLNRLGLITIIIIIIVTIIVNTIITTIQ